MECLGTTALCIVTAQLMICVTTLVDFVLPTSASWGGEVRPAKSVSCNLLNFNDILQNCAKYTFK